MGAGRLKLIKNKLDTDFKELNKALRRKDTWKSSECLHALELIAETAYKLQTAAVEEISNLEHEMYD